ncbi:MAG: hypothetical protein Q8N84_03590 [bacterium]|nr:hypothetical protein [bacterium]
MQSRFKSLGVIFVVGLFLSAFPVQASAQSALQLSPTMLDFDLTVGKQTLEKIEIFNPSLNSPQSVSLSVLDLVVEDETGAYRFEEDAHSRYSLSKWVTVEPKKFVLQPQENQKAVVTINLPENAEAGGHYGMLLAMGDVPALNSDAGVSVGTSGGVGVILLGKLPGEISYDGQLEEFVPVTDTLQLPLAKAPIPITFVDLGPVNFVLRFRNAGTVHYSPYGYVDVYDWFGGKVDQVTIKPQRVFPGKIFRVKTEWPRILLIGKYRAVATLFYGKAGAEKQISSEITFWAFPLLETITLLAVILVLFVVARLKKRFFGQQRLVGTEPEK